MSKKAKKLTRNLHERNYKKYGLDLNLTVSLTSALILMAFSMYAILNLEVASEQLNNFKSFVIERFDTLFVLGANFFIVVLLILAFSKAGKIRIGGKDTEPQFSNFGWYSMLISAGMGIGLMFWSVGEPIYHSSYSPIFTSDNSTYQALATTFFHWGIHPWAVYGVVSLALGFLAYNKNLPLSPRSFFYPILKEKVFGVFGDIIDILAVLSALAGLATSLGLGVKQINSGLNYLIGLEVSITSQVILISLITLVATISVVSGVDKGVRFLSELNIKAAFVFMLIIFLLGPTLTIVKDLFFSTGLYIKDFVYSSFMVNQQDADWSHGWTVFYWSWWISWSPFVGLFIAKVSKGRTVREFITATLLVPSILSIIWLGVFGSTAINVDMVTNGALSDVISNHFSIALFEMIGMLKSSILIPVIKLVIQALGVFLVVTFFITSSDSGSLVVDSLASGGKIKSPRSQRIFWAVMEGFIAAILLVVGGSEALSILQTAVVTTGLPFVIIILITSIVLLKELFTYKEV